MAYSEQFNVLWFNPIRSATRSTLEIQRFLKFTDFGTHDEPNENQKEFYFVSNIRNPYSRMVSIFYFLFRNENRDIDTFRLFVKKKVWEEQNLKNPPNLQLNLKKIFDKFGKRPDYLIKTENIYDDIFNLPFLQEKSNPDFLKLMDEKIKTNNFFQEYGKKPHWKEHYDEVTANTLYQYLEKDFKLGGYDKNSWQNGTS